METTEDVREQVRAKYGSAARAVADHGSAAAKPTAQPKPVCCGTDCCAPVMMGAME